MLNNVKRGIVILLSLCLAALAGCSLAYVDSADAKVSVTGEAEQLSLTLATAKGEVEYRSLSASGTGSFTFPSVYFGDYIVKAYGYEDGQLTGLGEGSRAGRRQHKRLCRWRQLDEHRARAHLESKHKQ